MMTMSPLQRRAMMEVLESHAQWSHTGRNHPNGRALLSRIASTPKPALAGATLELLVESAMMRLAGSNLLAADVLRLSHGAGWYGVIKRRRLNLKWKGSTTDCHAAALGIAPAQHNELYRLAVEFIFKELRK